MKYEFRGVNERVNVHKLSGASQSRSYVSLDSDGCNGEA